MNLGQKKVDLILLRKLSYNHIPIGGGGSKDNFSGLNFRDEKEESKSHKAYKHPDAAISSAER